MYQQSRRGAADLNVIIDSREISKSGRRIRIEKRRAHQGGGSVGEAAAEALRRKCSEKQSAALAPEVFGIRPYRGGTRNRDCSASVHRARDSTLMPQNAATPPAGKRDSSLCFSARERG